MRTQQVVGMCVAILCLTGFVNRGMAQTVYGMSELNNINSLRSLALGSATVAMDGYPGAAQINPASIGLHDIIQGSSYFTMARSRSMFSRPYGFGSLSQPNFDYRSDKWAAALFTTYYDLGTETGTDEMGHVVNKFHAYELAVSGSASLELSKNLRMGFGLRYLTSQLVGGYTYVGTDNEQTAHSIAADLGLLYQRPFNTEYVIFKPSAGWSLTNFGAPLHYSSTASDPLPMTMRGGLGLRMISTKIMYDRPLFSVGLYTQLSHVLARKDANGTAYGPVQSLFKGWAPYTYVSYYGGSSRSVGFTNQFFSHYGIEVSILGALNYRFGYINQPNALGYHNLKMFGIGADLYYVAFDYTRISNAGNSYSALSNGTGLWQITIRIPLKRPAGGIIPSLVD